MSILNNKKILSKDKYDQVSQILGEGLPADVTEEGVYLYIKDKIDAIIVDCAQLSESEVIQVKYEVLDPQMEVFRSVMRILTQK